MVALIGKIPSMYAHEAEIVVFPSKNCHPVKSLCETIAKSPLEASLSHYSGSHWLTSFAFITI